MTDPEMTATQRRMRRIIDLERENKELKIELSKLRSKVQKICGATGRLDLQRKDKRCECDARETISNNSGPGELCINCAGWTHA